MSETIRQPDTKQSNQPPDRRDRFFGRILIGSEEVVEMLKEQKNTLDLTTSDGALFVPYTKVHLIDTRNTSIAGADTIAASLSNRHNLQPSFLIELRKHKMARGLSGPLLKFIPPRVEGLWEEITNVRSSLEGRFTAHRVGSQEIHVPIGSFTHYDAARDAAKLLLEHTTVYTAGEFKALPIDPI